MNLDFMHGVVPPLLTPVDAEDRINEPALRRLVDYVINGGVHGILAFGSSGEFYSVEESELLKGLEIIMDQVQNRIPVYMSVGAIATRACKRIAQMANSQKVQAISILAPMAITPNDEDLYRHFRSIAEVSELPVLLYNNPTRVGYNLSLNLVYRLCQTVPNIIGMKDSSGNMTLTSDYLQKTRSMQFKIFTGKDSLVFPSLAYGAVGCVAATANIVPKLVVQIYDQYTKGDYIGAREAQFKLNQLRSIFDLATFPIAVKAAANLVGLGLGDTILPLSTCSEDIKQMLSESLNYIGEFYESK